MLYQKCPQFTPCHVTVELGLEALATFVGVLPVDLWSVMSRLFEAGWWFLFFAFFFFCFSVLFCGNRPDNGIVVK